MDDLISIYDLFIFDLDDTIVMTEIFHNKAWNIAISKELNKDYNLDFKEYCSIFHSNKKDYFKNYLNEMLNINNFLDICCKKNKIFLELIKISIPQLNEGVEDFINKIIKNNKKFIIVSNTSKENIEYFLNMYPILKNCDKYYHKDLFINKKPNPECYLKVCDDYPNMRKIGFEDSITGIEALYNVKEITPYFVNNKEYYHYNYILENYRNINIIENFYSNKKLICDEKFYYNKNLIYNEKNL
jgi:beta-phosphoglucomutase-like phosphatase (HAD superfamily)